MKMQNEDFKAWLEWAKQSPLRWETLKHLVAQWEREQQERQIPIQEFGTDFNYIAKKLESNHEKD